MKKLKRNPPAVPAGGNPNNYFGTQKREVEESNDSSLTETDPKVIEALSIARHLAENGVPIFLAKRDDTTSTGYKLPKNWQHTEPDPAVLDGYEPGMAVCAVMGHTVDAVDKDPRNGGHLLAELQPRIYGVQSTPSGGTHEIVAPLGVRSRDGILPGVDVKAGHGGDGRGFIFIAPTERKNHDGEIGGYEWTMPPDLDVLRLVGEPENTGQPLADLITTDRTADATVTGYDVPAYDALSPAQQTLAQQVQDEKLETWRAILADAATWEDKKRDSKGRGWEALARDFAWSVASTAANPWMPLEEPEAAQVYADIMPEAIAADPKCRGKFSQRLIAQASVKPVEAPPWHDFGVFDSGQTADPGTGLPTPYVDGGTFIFDIPDEIPNIWGAGNDVLWAEGEALMIVGGPGAGKTTLAGQVVRGLLFGGDLLGLPVHPVDGRVLYLAMDRPRQIGRSLRRHFTSNERDDVAQHLVVRPGPPAEDLALDTDLLTNMAQRVGATTVVVDSLKDAAISLSEDATGSGYNRTRQTALAAGINVLELHHQVKRGNKGSAPDTLADVYGSAWLTSGAGSVVLLHGSPGDSIVEMKHLKPVSEVVGPFKVFHDHTAGTSQVFEPTDPVALAAASGDAGLTVGSYATELHDTSKPTANQVEAARRKLDRLAKQGVLRKGQRENPAGGKPMSVYFTGQGIGTAKSDFGGGVSQ